MKVLLLTDGIYPYVTGGMQKHSFYLAKYLLKAGAQVSLVHCSDQDIQPSAVQLLFGNPGEQLVIHQVKFPSGARFPGHYLYRSYQYSKNIYTIIEKELPSFDFIYIQGFSGWYLLKQLKHLSLKAKVIINFHGLEMFQGSPDLKSRMQAVLLRKYTRKNILRSPFVHSLGGKLTVILRDRLGMDSKRIIEAPIGIEQKWLRENLETTPAKKEKIQLAFVGRNERRKGFPELMEALGKEQGKHFHLHVVGSFTGEKNANITWHGLIRDEHEIMKVLDDCDVLICPSYGEGMPTVILEAMSRGCAIAATDVGAVSEEVDASNGWLFEAGNQAALEKTLAEIAHTPGEIFMAKKRRSLEKIKEKFLWDHLINRLFSR